MTGRRGISAGTFLLWSGNAALLVTYVAFVLLQKYKVYYFGWAFCLTLAVALTLLRRLRVGVVVGDVLPLLAFYGLLALSASWAYDPHLTIMYVLADTLQLAGFAVGWMWAMNTPIWSLTRHFTTIVIANLLVSGFYLITVGSLVSDEFIAIRSSIALALATGIPFLVWRANARRSWTARLLVVIVILLILVLRSRTALLALPPLLLGSVLTLADGGRRRARLLVLWSGLTAGIVALALAVAPLRDAVITSIGRFGDTGLSLDVSTDVESDLALPAEMQVDVDRRLQALVALEQFSANPWLGGGYMSTEARTAYFYDRIGLSAHGLPFTLLGELGITGFLVFGWLVYGFFRSVRRYARETADPDERSFCRIAQIAMTGMLFFGLFHQLHQVPTFYVFLAWGYACRARARGRAAARVPIPAALAGAPA